MNDNQPVKYRAVYVGLRPLYPEGSCYRVWPEIEPDYYRVEQLEPDGTVKETWRDLNATALAQLEELFEGAGLPRGD